MLIIGESLNASVPVVRDAIETHNEEFIKSLAKRQVECGATMLDVNAGGLSGGDEEENLSWLIKTVQSAVGIPLVLDSANPETLHKAVKVYQGSKLILSSVTAEKESLGRLLPLAAELNCGIVGLCMNEKGIPDNPEGRVAMAEIIIEQAVSAGIKPEAVYIDPLVMTVSVDWRASKVTIDTHQILRKRFSQFKTFTIVGNVAFGMPMRSLVNRTFLAMIMGLGTDAVMLNVRDQELMSTLAASSVLNAEDKYCRKYIKAFRTGKLGKKSV
ncbi:MAG: dihydropteroate synthase [Proteobacteria bacterium]|nr:dihydropteroate synthase [Pseudomonadota bacterium]